MSKHTPGPWSDEKIWPTPDHLIHANVEGQPHALACAYGMRGVGEREANAKLIAAAPELLAVLDDLEGSFDKEIYPEQKKEDFDALDDREYTVTITAKQWRALGRAIGKATGGA